MGNKKWNLSGLAMTSTRALRQTGGPGDRSQSPEQAAQHTRASHPASALTSGAAPQDTPAELTPRDKRVRGRSALSQALVSSTILAAFGNSWHRVRSAGVGNRNAQHLPPSPQENAFRTQIKFRGGCRN